MLSTIFTAPDESTWIGILRLELSFPEARSRKDKRKSVARIRDRFRSRYNLAIAEVGHLENHKKSIMVASTVGNNQRQIRAMLDMRVNETHSLIDGFVFHHSITVLPFPLPLHTDSLPPES